MSHGSPMPRGKQIAKPAGRGTSSAGLFAFSGLGVSGSPGFLGGWTGRRFKREGEVWTVDLRLFYKSRLFLRFLVSLGPQRARANLVVPAEQQDRGFVAKYTGNTCVSGL